MPLITIITPTYNRSVLLSKLYKSLIEQSCYDFEWVIVDDGSIDNTEELANQFIENNIIDIKYYKQENGGKHRAVNLGIKRAVGELIIIVDSDDRITPNAIEIIKKTHLKYYNIQGICGYSFLRKNGHGDFIVKNKENEILGDHINNRIKNKLKGDMAEVFYTKILKEYQFKTFKNEKFLSEDSLWIEIAFKYKTIYLNKAIYICDYLEGGLTDSDKKMKFSSPIGSMYRGLMLMNKECGFRENIRGSIIWNCYKKEVSEKYKEYECMKINNYQKCLCIITKPLSIIFRKRWRREF